MRHSEAATAVRLIAPTRIPVCLSGPPGCGKTDLACQYADHLGAKLLHELAALRSELDVRGMPSIERHEATNKLRTVWTDSDLFWGVEEALATHAKVVLFIDELSAATPIVMNSFTSLFLEGKIGAHVLPGYADGRVYIMTAMNESSHKAGVSNLTSPIANRMIHLLLEPNVEDTCDYASGTLATHNADGTWGKGPHPRRIWHPYVIGFLRTMGDSFLSSFDANAYTSGKRAFASPRTFEFLSELLWEYESAASSIPPLDVLSGTVGAATGTEFLTFVTSWGQLPSFPEIQATPDKAIVPTTASGQYAVVGMLAHHSKAPATFPASLAYASRLPLPFQTLLIRLMLDQSVEFCISPTYNAWYAKNGSTLLGRGEK